MEKIDYNKKLVDLFNIVYYLYNEYFVRNSLCPVDENGVCLDLSDRNFMVKEILYTLSDYLVANIDDIPMKKALLLQVYYTDFEYIKQITHNTTLTLPLDHPRGSDNIINNLRNNREVLFTVLRQYFSNIAATSSLNLFSDKIISEKFGYYYKNKIITSIVRETFFDAENLYSILGLHTEDLHGDMYDYLFNEDNHKMPFLILPDEDFVHKNIDIYLEELYLNTLVFLKCKKESFGIDDNEHDILLYIREFINSPTSKKLPIPDFEEGEAMIKNYILLSKNKDKLLKYHEKTVDEALKLARKKFNPISVLAFKSE